jgi:hypothetical protein
MHTLNLNPRARLPRNKTLYISFQLSPEHNLPKHCPSSSQTLGSEIRRKLCGKNGRASVLASRRRSMHTPTPERPRVTKTNYRPRQISPLSPSLSSLPSYSLCLSVPPPLCPLCHSPVSFLPCLPFPFRLPLPASTCHTHSGLRRPPWLTRASLPFSGFLITPESKVCVPLRTLPTPSLAPCP